ncbi:MAG TPA: DUF1295 domain-containing protein [Verrucomicrobiae bacterium]|jgi:steroid 5-alpha reductase family enzyme
MFDELIQPFLIATGFAVALMLVIWRVALTINNLGIVDVAWSFGFLPPVIFFAATANGDPEHRWLMASMAGIWSLRLGIHIAARVIHQHPHEDVRYEKLRADWGSRLPRNSLYFFLFQAVILAALSTLFLIACLNPTREISSLEWSGVVVWLIALAGESAADRQLKRFKADPANQGRVCQSGLWNYSRHPNYFFEWLVWVGFFLFAWDAPGGCYTVLGPGLMLFFLLRVTGIPLTEELSLKSKGDAYREYQRTTSAFVPWFKKSMAQNQTH